MADDQGLGFEQYRSFTACGETNLLPSVTRPPFKTAGFLSNGFYARDLLLGVIPQQA